MYIQDELKDRLEPFLENMPQNMGDALGIRYTHFETGRVEAEMPVNENTIQPMGLLHGGASVALGETLCSIGAWLNLDTPEKTAVGLEINANHIKAVRNGKVKGSATPVHRGSNTQIWMYEVRTESGKLVCTGRCTLAIIRKRS